eukprot:m.1645156 g.1645156  ORF g.1645156 m.1645156 type:complete len:335 (-) comp65955_c0_seq1:6-1010(-)
MLSQAVIVATITALCTAASIPALDNIVELAASDRDLSTLVAALKAADLVSTLEGPGPFTVFAPSNEAFALLPPRVLEELLKPENKAELVKVLTYHVVAGDIQAKDIKSGEHVKTVEGEDVTPFISSGKVYIEGGSRDNVAEVIQADVEASNGVVHVINRVLIPPHVPGPEPPRPNATKNIVQLAESNPELSTLVKAVVAAGLADTLSGAGPFTVFAPTNEAFDKLPAGVLERLLEPANKAELVKVLTYHVLAADVQAKDIVSGRRVKTVDGEYITPFVSPQKNVFIEGGSRDNIARVIAANVEATNGVVHVIDEVLIPSPPPAKWNHGVLLVRV